MLCLLNTSYLDLIFHLPSNIFAWETLVLPKCYFSVMKIRWLLCEWYLFVYSLIFVCLRMVLMLFTQTGIPLDSQGWLWNSPDPFWVWEFWACTACQEHHMFLIQIDTINFFPSKVCTYIHWWKMSHSVLIVKVHQQWKLL